MRQLLCEACATAQALKAGERMALPPSDEGEPAEYERVAWGRARVPDPGERVMYVNDVPLPLPIDHYICDYCNATIRPGERCCARTVWLEGQTVPAWEHEYLEGETK